MISEEDSGAEPLCDLHTHFSFCVFFDVPAAAAYTFYRTLNQEGSLKRRGRLEDRNKTRRRRELTLQVSWACLLPIRYHIIT